MKMQGCLLSFFVVLLFLPQISQAQFYQGYQNSFGKSRIQYEDRFWTFFRQKRYDVYHYTGGQLFAEFAAAKVDQNLDQIEKLLDYKLEGRIRFIVFNTLNDMRQSNIGIPADDAYNIGGTTKIIGNKVFLYFDGNHDHLIEQIRAGIAQILVNQILFGGDIKDALQNAALLTLPEWYMSGVVSYIASGWSTDIDNRVKDGIITERYKKFNRLQGDDAMYAGHSIWSFIMESYGEQSISNLLYMTRVNRSIESGFLFVLGVSSKGLQKAWFNFYSERFKDEANGRSLPEKPKAATRRATQVLTQSKISPDGSKLSYVVNETGRCKIYLLDLETGKRKVLLRRGYRTYEHETDLSFPILNWNPDGKSLTWIRNSKGKVWMTNYIFEPKEKIISPLLNFEKVFDFSYSDNGQNIVMSALQKGMSDIYVYNLRTRIQEQITNDHFDDYHPRFIENSTKIAFASDRFTDSLEVNKSDSAGGSGQTDVFIYDYKKKSNVLMRVTNTPNANENFPSALDTSYITFLGDANGVRNRYVAHLDSTLSYVDTIEHYRDLVSLTTSTNYSRSILSDDLNSRSGKISEILYSEGKYQLFVKEAPKTESLFDETLELTPFRRKEEQDELARKLAQERKEESARQSPIIIDVESPQKINDSTSTEKKQDVYQGFFQDEFNYRRGRHLNTSSPFVNPTELPASNLDTNAILAKKSSGLKRRNYKPTFTPSYLQFQIDNSLLSPTYQLFTGTGPVSFGQGINLLARISTADLFDNYKVTGAVRVAGDFRTIGYYASVENLKKRLDKQVTFYREGRTYSYLNGQVLFRVHTNELKYILKYPFTETLSLKGTIGIRTDRGVLLTSDFQTLRAPNVYAYAGLGKLEFIFDNTISRGLNLPNGIRLKVFAEMFNQDSLHTDMEIFGLDVRYYQKVHREIVWANRFAASASMGSQKLIYYLGGTDNWFSPKFDSSIPIDNTEPYAFHALATNMRGFQQNVRNGSNFALINSELRFPVFKYFISRPIKSDFIKNFQIVGFGDIGTAWSGASPFDSTNALNSTIINTPPITVTLNNQRQPIVGGYGAGLRSRVLGYFARIDIAWGVEDRVVKPRIIYFSLSLDF